MCDKCDSLVENACATLDDGIAIWGKEFRETNDPELAEQLADRVKRLHRLKEKIRTGNQLDLDDLVQAYHCRH